MNNLWSIAILVIILTMSCQENTANKSEDREQNSTQELPNTSQKVNNDQYQPQRVDDELATKIKKFLNNKYLTSGDLRAIQEEQRQFQF